MGLEEAKQKIFRYCAYQERSHKEVKTKLYGYGLYASQVDEIISQLITDGFLNEERFAKAFAGCFEWVLFFVKNSQPNCLQKKINHTLQLKQSKVEERICPIY